MCQTDSTFTCNCVTVLKWALSIILHAYQMLSDIWIHSQFRPQIQ